MDESYLSDGHLWIQEYVVGGVLRFKMDPSGLLHFGDSKTEFDEESIPLHYQPSVAEIRQDLDRDRLREGVDTVEAYTFLGVAPLGDGLDYEWAAQPAFFGHDIWDGTASSFAPEDVVDRVFDAVGIETVPTFEKELPARHFEPSRYVFPQSALMDSSVPGVVLRKKHGQPAVKYQPEWSGRATESRSTANDSETVEEWVDRFVTREFLETVIGVPQGSIWNQPLDETLEAVTRELARREFGRVGQLVETRPESFVSVVSERIESLRRDEIG